MIQNKYLHFKIKLEYIKSKKIKQNLRFEHSGLIESPDSALSLPTCLYRIDHCYQCTVSSVML